MLATTFGVGQVTLTILWFALLFIEVWLLVMVFADIFRSHDLPGWAKALWVLALIIFPLIGIIAYLIVRGDKLRLHEVEATKQQDEMFRAYVRSVVREELERSRYGESAPL